MPQPVRDKIGRQAPAWSASFRQPPRRAARRMSTPSATRSGFRLYRVLRLRPSLAAIAAVLVFLWCVSRFYQPDTGFSSLISIGDILEETKVTSLRQTPHHVYEKSAGYDGAYYVQLALYPTLDNPELTKAIDNLPYRAKRILFCWAAWLLGGGQPGAVVQAHALLNVACWLALAWVLLRWFPPNTWENFLRWAFVLFSHGLCMSVRHSLVDGPSLLLVALALRWLEDGRRGAGAVTLALAGLGKETSLLAGAGLEVDWRAPRSWWRPAATLLMSALPLFLWMGYVRWKFGPADDPGMGNFTLPFVGFAEKFRYAWREATGPDGGQLAWASLVTIVALAVQWTFFVLRRRPGERWWRVGAAFALMMTFLSTPVWEGFPGASTRVLLPMTLAFNVLVPRGRRWLPVLLAGNLTVAATIFEYSPPHEFFALKGDPTTQTLIRVKPLKGWYAPEQHLAQQWRWTTGAAELRLTNASDVAVTVTIRGLVSAADGECRIRIGSGDRLLWGESAGVKPREFRFGLTLAPGETRLSFTGDQPAKKIGADPRELAFRIANLEIVVPPAGMRP